MKLCRNKDRRNKQRDRRSYSIGDCQLHTEYILQDLPCRAGGSFQIITIKMPYIKLLKSDINKLYMLYILMIM